MKNGSKPRLVIDTNVLISGIVFGGKPRQLLNLLAEGAIIVIVAEELLTELRRKIVMKFPEFVEDLERVERLLKRDASLVKLGTVQVTISRDADDNKFIEAAVIGGAGYIVSGDNDLLVLKSYGVIKILKPADFLELMHKPKL